MCEHESLFIITNHQLHFKTITILCFTCEYIHCDFSIRTSLLETHTPIVSSSISIRTNISRINDRFKSYMFSRLKKSLYSDSLIVFITRGSRSNNTALGTKWLLSALELNHLQSKILCRRRHPSYQVLLLHNPSISHQLQFRVQHITFSRIQIQLPQSKSVPLILLWFPHCPTWTVTISRGITIRELKQTRMRVQ